ncbi:MAG: hypothetical protein KatS3mg064_1094 [Tepidiforma sp.]|nr:MAG: hypothetical protein KatS3mg064_1094 [Tepidiforma sp.]
MEGFGENPECRPTAGRGTLGQLAAPGSGAPAEGTTPGSPGRFRVDESPLSGTPAEMTRRYLALAAEYEQFRFHMPDALLEMELPSMRVTYLNAIARALLGYTVEDMLGGIYGWQLLEQESLQRAIALSEESLARQVRKGLPYERRPGQYVSRYTVIRKDGIRVPVEAQGAFIVDERGVPTGARFIFRDITERVVREREHARLAAIVESAEDAIISRDLEGRILSWNRGAERLYGWTAAEMLGRTADMVAAPGAESEVAELLERVKRGEHLHLTTRRRRRDGTVFDIELSLFPVRDEHGEVTAVGGIARDISEPLRVAQELERTNRLLAALTRAQSDFIREGEPSGVFQALLDLLLELTESEYGFIGEVLRKRDGSPYLRLQALVFPGTDQAQAFMADSMPAGFAFDNLATLFGHTLRTGEPVISNEPAGDPRAGGTPPGHPELRSYLGVPIASRGELVGMVGLANRPGGYSETAVEFLRPLVTTCATLIEALRSERQREEERCRLEMALERSEITLWEWDVAADTITAFAGDREGLQPSNPTTVAWLERVHPEDRAAVERAFRAHATGETDHIEVEHRYLMPGGTWAWTLSRGRIVDRGPRGEPLRAVGTFLNISSRKEAELERARLELQMRQAQKLESLGVLAGGIAHDFNNLLTAVLGNLFLLRQALPDDPALRELVDDASHAAERGAELVRRLLAFGRPDIDQPDIVDLDALIADAAALARPMVEPTVRLVIRRSREAGRVKGSASALSQVLVNLFVNARDAMPGGGVITVTRAATDLGSRRRWAPPELPRGRYHVIAVRDTGTGIPPELLEKIFDPFFTTKPIGKGSGLGLPTALAIARAHGGWLSAESSPGRGSTFRLLLPALEGPAAG